MRKYQVIRALGVGVSVILTGLLIYDKPPTDVLAALWLPSIQGALAFLATLGVNASVKSRSA